MKSDAMGLGPNAVVELPHLRPSPPRRLSYPRPAQLLLLHFSSSRASSSTPSATPKYTAYNSSRFPNPC